MRRQLRFSHSEASWCIFGRLFRRFRLRALVGRMKCDPERKQAYLLFRPSDQRPFSILDSSVTVKIAYPLLVSLKNTARIFFYEGHRIEFFSYHFAPVCL